ncbi:MAG: hypothetical protein QOE30_3095 [Mycobacterium sp.]|jgi:hypothetical protein|uniref:hypothetical protein n=1 Tax=Mycobacterium sp. TaxID=1785 RepID=UPI0028B46ACF|nr:hypothetical protein [Mycobacterium sp.]MDT5117356.1 hypothetical protein [Mycobacterium sp.]
MDLDKLATLFAEDARVTFGNEPPYVGVRAIRDGTHITLPAATVYHADGDGKIDDYRVFLDVTPIYV